MKKVLALMGSPRRDKNTETLLDYLLDGVLETGLDVKKIYIGNKEISPCTGCGYCEKKGECVFKDDMEEIYEEFDNRDIFILSAPLYFNSLNSKTKAVIDRCQKYWSIKYVLGQSYKKTEDRIGIFMSVGGAPYSHDQFSGTIPIMDLFFKAINANYLGNYFVSNTDILSVNEREDIKEELFEIGKSITNIKDFYLHR